MREPSRENVRGAVQRYVLRSERATLLGESDPAPRRDNQLHVGEKPAAGRRPDRISESFAEFTTRPEPRSLLSTAKVP